MKKDPSVLFEKLLGNACSKEELDTLIAELAKDEMEDEFQDLLLHQLATPVNPEQITPELKAKLEDRLTYILTERTNEVVPNQTIRKMLSRYYKYAAAVLLILSIGLLFYNHQRNIGLALAQLDKIPTGNSAVLTLADGSLITLQDAKNGKLAEQAGVEVFKNKDGLLTYTEVEFKNKRKDIAFNSITTPKGCQYQLLLPDGTKVWLSTASTLSYPASFNTVDIREVKLSGEAYFEVSKRAGKPFRVKAGQQLVEVLGTHFNVNNYVDEPLSHTTLLEGSVKVSGFGQFKILKPGQQATINEKRIHVSTIDAEEAIAWKNGYFQFNDEELESIMRKASRWYDVDVVYDDPALKHVTFAGLTNRFSKISELLNILKMTKQVDFDVEGRTIRVKKN